MELLDVPMGALQMASPLATFAELSKRSAPL